MPLVAGAVYFNAGSAGYSGRAPLVAGRSKVLKVSIRVRAAKALQPVN